MHRPRQQTRQHAFCFRDQFGDAGFLSRDYSVAGDVAPGAEIVNVRALDQNGAGLASDADGLEAARMDLLAAGPGLLLEKHPAGAEVGREQHVVGLVAVVRHEARAAGRLGGGPPVLQSPSASSDIPAR